MKRSQKGFALILVIWVLVLMSGIAASFSRALRVETSSSIQLTDQVHAEAVANAGLHRAVLGILQRDVSKRWKANGQRYEIPWPDAKLDVTIRSESGKIDINYAPRALLSGLLQNVLDNVDAGELADRIIDWRDRDSQTSPLGAEANDYRSAGYRYIPPNGPFATISELAQVMGFDGEMVETLRPYMTVHSRRPRIDAGNADIEVLSAIPGIDRTAAEAFITDREQRIANAEPLVYDTLDTGRQYLDSRPNSSVLSIDSEVQLNNGYRLHERAVVNARAGGKGFEILSWQRVALSKAEDKQQP